MPATERPLSPHIQIYRPQITSGLSIFHRITGVALTLGTLLLTWWLVSAAYGPEAFATAQAFLGSLIGQLVLWGFTFAVFYHLANGVRHLLWDFGWGFELEQLRFSGIVMLAFAAVATLVTLIAGYSLAGGQ
ncbi:MAG: succinate dehydrogenase, cytochrome b556 subunit [Rhodospirillales bacterium]|uniref:Succinate dehydrogenase cytochrome b556 subunit n=2 Tax=root TaxID=1 RepID=A0A564WCL1_9PROT|nr:succinate dehydrogenase, cytochrome b556 subunit [Rhodospirillales bacterium]SUS04194.1 Succinate dehydrogenase cytochrome b556 subunit [uncultured Defluviicoccus sp.]VUX45869.1 Succinate dehydrogenase cytochrome b556 subunit [Candidatus Defluviicoccus seviourii]HRW61763.1 succinate dehydrogenase, cytochrome b556 subunit [Defluviicoccus sp.]